MKTIVRIFVPAVVALGFAGQAGAGELLVETEYPGPAPTVMGTNAGSSESEPYLIQSNNDGPRVNPVFESRTTKSASRSGSEIRAEATIAVPYGPAMNA